MYPPGVIVNGPNILTMLRIVAIPALVAVMLTDFAGRDLVAFAVFVPAALTDWVDGWWARRKNQTTVFGELLDPTADKLLVAAALVCLQAQGRVPAWMVVVIIGRELAVSGFRALASSRGVHIPALLLGKAKMALETWTIAGLILGAAILGRIYIIPRVGLWLVLVAALVSAAEYYIRYWPRIASARR
jgi:CDP-diacylglycerol--glycerol-3-phosphate 3-phosphatidyltransferase